MSIAVWARLYARVSTEEQAQSGFSLGAQQERLEAFCISQGWQIAGCYVDEGVSAKDLNRPAFRRMVGELEPGDVVLVHKLDRLTRSVRDLDDLLREFEQRGVHFRSATEQFDTTTATGRLFIRMVAEMAQWERETIAERAAFGKRKKAGAGEWAGGTPPFGYATTPSGRVKAGRALLQLIPDPERSHLIPMIFERYLQGYGIRAIAGWLNTELGVRTPQGKRFHQLTISRILTNPIYCGDIEYGRRREQMRTPGSHPPLVSRAVFAGVQELMQSRKAQAPRQATGIHPLAGLARCGVCGGRIDGVSRSDRSGSRVYRCHNYMTGMGCGQGDRRSLASVSAALVEESLLAQLEPLLPTSPDFTPVLGEPRRPDHAEARRIQRDLESARAAVGRWKRLFEQGHISDEEYLAEVRPHLERVKVLEGLPLTGAVPAPPPPTLSLCDVWKGLEPQQRKTLLRYLTRTLGVRVLIFPDRQVALQPEL